MKTFLTHFVIATLAVALWIPGMAHAATGSWQWQDISGQLTTRTNRPVWAMTFANGNWFYTDGQDLNNGGQVYRFDGQTQVNITNDVRNAGVNRVDDIVSDNANTVLFLQDIVRYDNQLKVVSYQNGTFSNRTAPFRNALGIDEGISTLVGQNGEWMMVTTKGRVFKLTNDFNGVSRISLPISGVNRSGDMKYRINHGYDLPINIVPLNGYWFFTIETASWSSLPTSGTTNVQFYIYKNGQFTKTYPETSTCGPQMNCSGISGVSLIKSNGSHVLVMYDLSGTHFGFGVYRIFNGSTWSAQTTYASSWSGSTSGTLPQTLENTIVASDGTSWMAIGNKKLVLLDSGNIVELGEVRDYFVTAAGDTSGHFLLGGAVSETGNSNPTNPLTAKLVLVTESGATAFNPVVTNTDTNTNTSANTDSGTGMNRWAWLDPNVTSIKKDGNVTFYVGAQDNDGIKKIEITVNGTIKRTCDLANAKGNQQCAYTIYANDYPQGTDIFVNAKVTDGKDKETWTSATTIRRETDNTSSNTQASDTGTGISQWTWLEPNQTTLANNSKITFHVGAQDGDGIKTVEIYVNGNVRRTCSYGVAAYGNQECSYDLWASDYPLNTDIFVNARVTDGQDKVTWTQSQTIRRDGSNTEVNATNANGISAWSWFENTADLKQGQSVTFRAQAWAEQGLASMEVFVNGQSKRFCNFSNANGNQDCNYTVVANDYAAGSTVSASVKATDKNGKTVTSDARQIKIVAADGGSSGSTSGSASKGDTQAPHAWQWLTPKQNSVSTNEAVRYYAEAWDNTGVKSMTQYVNGKPEYTCNFYPGTGNQQCWIEISGKAHPAGSTFFVNTLVKDFAGNETWTSGETVTVTQAPTQEATTPAPTQTSPPTKAPAFETWSYLSGPTTVTNGTKTTYAAAAWAEKGVRRITMYVNGTAQYPCTYWPGTGNQECRFDVMGSSYPKGTTVSVNALVTDFTGQEKWTGLVAIPVN